MKNKVQLRKNFNKKGFDPGASIFKMALWYFASLFFIRSGIIPSSSIIVLILKLFGAKIGKDVRIKPGLYIHLPWRLQIGDHSWIARCRIENLADVSIGKNVCVSQEALLLTGNHDYKKTEFDLITKPILLEEGVWIGARAIVCPGITAHSHSILTVGSVATRDLEAYSIYQGNPAEKIKNREIY